MNCQPIKDYIKVPQDRLLYPLRMDNKKKHVFEKKIKCVTRPDLSVVPLISLKHLTHYH